MYFYFFILKRKRSSKSGCFSPWKFQFCENHLFTGQPSQRESPASPTANISAHSLELIQRSFTPLDIFITDLNKLWTRLFWQEYTQSGNLKINPDFKPSTALQPPWWSEGMSLSEWRWWSDLAIPLAGYLFLFAVINKETESILRPKSLEFFINYFPLNHQLQTEDVSENYLVFAQKVFSAVIAPEIYHIVILRYRKWRSPSMVQFDCNSSFENQGKVCPMREELLRAVLFIICILSMVWEVDRSQNEEKKNLGCNESWSSHSL